MLLVSCCVGVKNIFGLLLVFGLVSALLSQMSLFDDLGMMILLLLLLFIHHGFQGAC